LIPTIFKNPIKSFLGDVNIFSISHKELSLGKVKIKHNTVNLQDDYFQFAEPVKKQFYSVSNIGRTELYKNDEMGTIINMHLEDSETEHNRSLYSVLEGVGQFGMIFGIFHLLGGILVNYVNMKLLKRRTFEDLYQIDKRIISDSNNRSHSDLNENSTSDNQVEVQFERQNLHRF
jgi:hypothetical protein